MIFNSNDYINILLKIIMYGELLDELISLCNPITTLRINSFLNDLITESKNENDDELDLEGKINKYFDINTNNNNGSSILGIMSGHSAGFSKESNDFKIGFSETNQSSSKNYEITVEITKDDKYRGFVDRLFHYLVNENDKNIENFFKDLYEKVKNDLTEVSEV